MLYAVFAFVAVGQVIHRFFFFFCESDSIYNVMIRKNLNLISLCKI